jgi:twitching motility protein PilT
MAFSVKNLESLIKVALDNNASDIHIRSDETPCFRIYGELNPVQTKKFNESDVRDICKIIFPDSNNNLDLHSLNEYDGSYSIQGLCRVRYNFFRYSGGFGLILRLVKTQIPSIKDLGLPSILNDISLRKRGLILVTGATGSGKSTTLAAMIKNINDQTASHIVTIEDPIEYVHEQSMSRVTQREIGIDTRNFTDALRSALRQDPDAILVGELRDPETISTALKAAETGHLVLSTVHTTDAISTIGRIISMFPPNEQEEVRKRFAENLCATISQRMLKCSSVKGMIPAFEILVNSPGVKECIRGEEPLSRILNIMHENYEKGGNGSQSFDQHIMRLYEKDIISKQTALDAASNQSDFIQKLMVD